MMLYYSRPTITVIAISKLYELTYILFTIVVNNIVNNMSEDYKISAVEYR